MSTVKRAVASAAIVSAVAFLGLSLVVHLAFLFLLVIPGGVALYGALGTRKKPPELPSFCCPCGGEWGAWGDIRRISNYHPDDSSTRYTQARRCKDCGYAESRRVA